MACKSTSPSLAFTALLLVSVVLLAIVTEAAAVRNMEKVKNTDDDDKKQPEFFLGGGFPGIDKLKHKFGLLPHIPTTGFLPPNTTPSTGSFPSPSTGGGSGGAGGSTGHGYVPGGDDTFVPNPGFEVPYPGGGNIPATPHP